MEVPRRGRAIGVWAPAGVWKMRTGVRLIWNSKDWAGSLAAAAFLLRESSNTSSRVKTRELSSFRRPFICEDCNCWRNHRSCQEILGSEGSKFRLASWGWLNLAGRHPAPRNPGGLWRNQRVSPQLGGAGTARAGRAAPKCSTQLLAETALFRPLCTPPAPKMQSGEISFGIRTGKL